MCSRSLWLSDWLDSVNISALFCFCCGRGPGSLSLYLCIAIYQDSPLFEAPTVLNVLSISNTFHRLYCSSFIPFFVLILCLESLSMDSFWIFVCSTTPCNRNPAQLNRCISSGHSAANGRTDRMQPAMGRIQITQCGFHRIQREEPPNRDTRHAANLRF